MSEYRVHTMNVLVACEFSGIVRDAFIRAGHNAVSCDLIPSESPGPHIQGPVENLALAYKWDLVIAHPPCTYLCNSGVRWLKEKPVTVKTVQRWQSMRDASRFFKMLYNLPTDHLCIENPIPHRYANLPKYSQIIHPWQFGHPVKKSTCLWLRNLPPLRPTHYLPPDLRRPAIHMHPDSKNRSKNRSRFFTGIAEAMASQWGNL